jgi:peptidoglycan/xylan/chitin deacetylase (PgdA/CDA1 family)
MADLSYGGCETYMAAAKDTVSAVSKHFGVAESWLKRINCLAGDTLETGQTLIIRRPAAPSVLIYRGDTPQKKIALTYDCGDSGAGETPALLDMLSRNRVRASFFLVGEWAEQFPICPGVLLARATRSAITLTAIPTIQSLARRKSGRIF